MSLTIPVSDLFSERKGITSKHETWPVVELKEVVQVQNGFPFESRYFNLENGLPLIRIRDILMHKSETFYSGPYDVAFVVREGDLLVGMDGDFNCTLWRGDEGLLNQRVCRLVVNENRLLKRFLYYGLGGYLKVINDFTSSVTVKHLSSNSIKEIPFPLPPMPVQKRIVAKLDTLFAHLDQLKSRLDKIPVLLKQFRQAVLTQAVTGKLTEPNRRSWRKITLEDLCDKITDGEHITPPISKAGIPLLSAKDVRDGYIDFTECKYVSNEFAKKSWQRCNPQAGDVLVVSRGATVGRSSLINTNKNFCLMGSVLLFKPKAEFILSQYLDIFFKSPFGLIEIVNMSGATAQQAVYIRDMKRMSIPLPEIEEQKEIVRKVESLLAFAEKIQLSHESLRERINRLPQNILSRAFQGELAKPTFIESREPVVYSSKPKLERN